VKRAFTSRPPTLSPVAAPLSVSIRTRCAFSASHYSHKSAEATIVFRAAKARKSSRDDPAAMHTMALAGWVTTGGEISHKFCE
jgi:hypothetical protein